MMGVFAVAAMICSRSSGSIISSAESVGFSVHAVARGSPHTPSAQDQSVASAASLSVPAIVIAASTFATSPDVRFADPTTACTWPPPRPRKTFGWYVAPPGLSTRSAAPLFVMAVSAGTVDVPSVVVTTTRASPRRATAASSFATRCTPRDCANATHTSASSAAASVDRTAVSSPPVGAVTVRTSTARAGLLRSALLAQVDGRRRVPGCPSRHRCREIDLVSRRRL